MVGLDGITSFSNLSDSMSSMILFSVSSDRHVRPETVWIMVHLKTHKCYFLSGPCSG